MFWHWSLFSGHEREVLFCDGYHDSIRFPDVENGGFGATFGVPIGALMMEQYLNGKLSPESQAKVEYIRERAIYYDTER